MGVHTRAAVIERIVGRADLDDFAERILDSFWERPEFQAHHPPRDRALRLVRWNLDLVIRWLTAGRPPTDSELEVFRRQARDRAAEGFPADIVLANFRRGARFAWRALNEAATDKERPALLESADLLFDYVDRVSRIFAEVYERASRAAASGSPDEAVARRLLARIAADEQPDADEYDLAERLNFGLDRAARPFVVALPGPATEYAAHAELAARLRASEQRVLAASEGRRTVGLADARTPWPAVAAELPDTAVTAVTAHGEPALGPERGRALDDLRAVVEIALARGQIGAEIDPADCLPELLLHRSPRLAKQIERRVYGALSDELAHTLDVLIKHSFERSSTAAELPVHRNTLRDRITRINDLANVDLGTADGGGLAWLAWLHRRASPSRPTRAHRH